MSENISQALRILAYTYPDHRAEAAASAIMRNAFSPAYGEAWTPAQLSSFMTLTGVRLSFACLDNAHLGFALTRYVLNEAELLLIATDPRWQSRGIGKFLLQDCVNHARKSRISAIHLEVRCNNQAIEFYLRNGFEQVHRRPAYYKGDDGTYYDALSFRLSLD